jgi:hypothetical protein
MASSVNPQTMLPNLRVQPPDLAWAYAALKIRPPVDVGRLGTNCVNRKWLRVVRASADRNSAEV